MTTDGPTLIGNIGNALKYNPDKENPQLLVLLQKNLGLMEQIFKQVNDATVTEIELVADGIAAVSALKQPSPADKPAIKEASNAAAKSAFLGDVTVLDPSIQLERVVIEESIKPIPIT